MINSKLLHSFFLLFYLTTFAFSSSLTSFHKCSEEQSDDLLLFKQNLSSISNSTNSLINDYCHNWLGSDYYPIMMNWNTSTDCCSWDGVTCDHITGDVIGLDLSCGMLQGTILPNTSLFNLPHLEKLNLAFNDFTDSKISPTFSNSLTHLNISSCGFKGQVPMEITLLRNLVSLDLSLNWFDLNLEPHVFINLLRNSTILEELSLEGVNIFSVLPTYLNISSSSLKLLNLGSTRLQGKLHHEIFNLQSLEQLDLSRNEFTGQIPSEISLLSKLVSLDLSENGFGLQIQSHILNNLLYNSTTLKELSLQGVNISSVLPTYLNITSLRLLDLSSTGLKGKLPDNIFGLQYLEKLDMSDNDNLNGPFPKVNTSTSIPLTSLHLSSTNLLSEIPDSVGHLKSLNYLYLSSCRLVGSLPKSLANLTQLIALILPSNMLNGTLPSWLNSIPSLEYIVLNNNMFSGNVQFESFAIPSLFQLSLGHNRFDGQIDVLDQSPILQTFHQLTNLGYLDLSYNNLKGEWELDTLLSTLTNLKELRLSYSGLSVLTNNSNRYVNPDFAILHLASCKIKVFPESLRAMRNLHQLNLSRNDIHGHIPDWAVEIGGNQLFGLDLSYNSITGLPQFKWEELAQLNLQSNLIEGPFPSSICNMSKLNFLDMSNNSFVGRIPQCFGNIFSTLSAVDLANNRLRGTIPNVYKDCGHFQGLILNGNELEGEVPSSLSKCRSLKVIDLGNNHFDGKFPGWLGDLPNLQALVLKSNNFIGPIEIISSTVEFPFPSLRVLDLSHNEFVGQLPLKYSQNFNAIKSVVKNSTKPEYLNMNGLYYSATIVIKGVDQAFLQIFIDYTIIDLSNNRFEGEIPNNTGSLKSLKVLNLSHNSLNGRIPFALGNLSEIESLDLSWNRLTGEIPRNLADITGLAVLNLSKNNLVGRIPQGKQFNTFDVNSFGGNSGLCGFPLPMQCEHPNSPRLEGDGDEEEEDEDENGFEWKVVMFGYGCGTVIGLVLGYLMLSTGKPKWFNAISDAAEHMILKRRNMRRYIYIGK